MKLDYFPKELWAGRVIKSQALGRAGLGYGSTEVAQQLYPEMPSVASHLKAPVAGLSLNDSGGGAEWAATDVQNALLEAVRSETVIDRLQFRRRVPFNVRIPREAAAGFGGAWVGAGLPIPVWATEADQVRLAPAYISSMSVITVELERTANLPAELAIGNAMKLGNAEYTDKQFLDPGVSAVAGVNPASITFGSTEVTSTGSTAAQILADLKAMINAIRTSMRAPRWIMSRRQAVALAGTLTTGGSPLFPDVNARGGRLLGIDVLTSAAVPEVGSPTAWPIVLLDEDSVLVADEGRLEFSGSKVTSIQMDDTPTNSAATGSGSSSVSMFQTESIALKVTRQISWERAHDGGVAYMLAEW